MFGFRVEVVINVHLLIAVDDGQFCKSAGSITLSLPVERDLGLHRQWVIPLGIRPLHHRSSRESYLLYSLVTTGRAYLSESRYGTVISPCP